MNIKKLKLVIILFLGSSLLLHGCAKNDYKQKLQLQAKELYYKGMKSYEEDFFTEAITNFEKVIETYPGTRMAAWSYLMLAESHFKQSEWEEAELNYRLFLSSKPDGHLTPYVLNRLISLNYDRNVTGIVFTDRDYERDMEPNHKIVQEYQKFYFLYPQNAYLPDVKDSLRKARMDLAEHEFMVGNFYLDQKAYFSAINRYLYLLKHFPEFPRTREVVTRLVEAYEATQQKGLAKEMRHALKNRFAKSDKSHKG